MESVPQTLLENCSFKENCFIVGNLSTNITISNSTFQSYRHETASIITVYSSTLILNGNVNFTDSAKEINYPGSLSGTAVFLSTTNKYLNSLLEITADANMNFVNLSSSNFGAAVYAENARIDIGSNTTLIFTHNRASSQGGALYMKTTTITVGTGACITFAYNTAQNGGALFLHDAVMNLKPNVTLNFSCMQYCIQRRSNFPIQFHYII